MRKPAGGRPQPPDDRQAMVCAKREPPAHGSAMRRGVPNRRGCTILAYNYVVYNAIVQKALSLSNNGK